MKLSRRNKKYIKKLMYPTTGRNIKIKNIKLKFDNYDGLWHEADIVNKKGEIIGDALFLNGKYETGHWHDNGATCDWAKTCKK
jgi:hypothetical protein